VTDKSVLQIGGSIEKALQGEYTLDVNAILKEAWSITLRSRISINLGLFITLIFGTLVSFIVSQYLGGIEQVFKDPQASTLLNIIVTVAIYPFLVGVEMMGVFHAVGLKTHVKLIFSFLKRGSWVAICALLTSTLVSLGLALFYIPGIFLAVSLSLALPLVVEKKLSPIKAITLCIKATRFQWFKICSLYLILILALFLSILPLLLLANSELSVLGGIVFIVALTFIAPMFYNVKGILYREIFGMKLLAVNSENVISDDVFSA
jgi:hypothetical protein